MKRKRKILIISGIIIFILLISGYWFLQSDFLLNKIRGILVAQLENQLKTDVKVGQISGHLLHGLKIKNVTIADKKEPKKTAISIEELEIDYKLLRLLKRTFAIKKLTLQNPLIYATVDERGNLNLTELIPESEPSTPESQKEKPFSFQVKELKLVDGQVHYTDKLRHIDANINGIHLNISGPLSPWNHVGKLSFRNTMIEVNGVKKQIDNFDTDFHFTETDGELKRLHIEMDNSWLQARANISKSSDMLQAKVDGQIDLKDIAGFLPQANQLEGIANLDISASGSLDAIVGKIEMTLPKVILNNLRADNILIDANFTKDAVNVNSFSFNFADGKILGAAQAQIIDGQPYYDAELSINSIQPHLLLSMLGFQLNDKNKQPLLTGGVDGKIKLNGIGTDLNSLNADGKFELLNGKLNNISFLPSTANFNISNDQLNLNANVDEIKIELTGQLGLSPSFVVRHEVKRSADTQAGKTDLNMSLTGIDLSRFADLLLIPKFRKPSEAPVSPAKAPGVGLPVRSTQTGDRQVLGDFTGSGALQVKITGNLIKPEAIGNLTIQDIAMNGTRIGDVTGKFRYSENRILIDPLNLRNRNTKCTVTGKATLSDEPTVDLKIAIAPLQIAEYAPLINAPIDLEGQVMGEIFLRGPVAALNGGGKLVFENTFASLSKDYVEHSSNPPKPPLIKGAFPLPIEMTVPLKLKRGILQIPKFALRTAGGELQINAVYDPKLGHPDLSRRRRGEDRGEYQFQINSKDFNVASFLDAFGIRGAGGYAQLSASGKGSIAKPQAKIHLDVSSLQYADFKLGDVAFDSDFHDNKLQFNILALRDAFKLKGEVDAAGDMPFNIDAQLENLNLGMFADTFTSRIGGKIAGDLKMTGELANIRNSEVNISIQSVVLYPTADAAGLSLADATGLPRYRLFNPAPIEIKIANQMVNVERFELIEQRGETLHSLLAVKGQLSPKQFDFTIQSDELDLSLFNEFFDGNPTADATGLSGLGNFNLRLTGSFSNPEFALNWSFPEITIEFGIPNSEFRIPNKGRITYRNKLLSIDQIKLSLYGNPLTLEGIIPIDLTFSSTADAAGLSLKSQPLARRFLGSKMRLGLTMSDWDVSFIDRISDIEKINGRMNANIEVSGSPTKPQISGNISISDVFIESPKLPQPVENLSANIRLNSASETNNSKFTFNLDAIRWNIGKGRYSAYGKIQYPQIKKEITSWFNADGKVMPRFSNLEVVTASLNAINAPFIKGGFMEGLSAALRSAQAGIAKPYIDLTIQGTDMELSAPVKLLTKSPNLPFDGRASMRAILKGTPFGIKPQNFTAKVEIEPLLLKVGDYDWRNPEKIEMIFQDGKLQFSSLKLKSNTRQPMATLFLSGWADLNGHFDISMLAHQFNLEMFTSLTDAFALRSTQLRLPVRLPVKSPTPGASLGLRRNTQTGVRTQTGAPHSANPPLIKGAFFRIPEIGGLASVWLDAKGTLAEPEAKARFKLQRVSVQNVKVDAIEGSADLKDGVLTLNRTTFTAYDNELNVYGTIPLGMRKAEGGSSVGAQSQTEGVRQKSEEWKNGRMEGRGISLLPTSEGEPMQIFIKGENLNLAPLAALSPVVQEISGIADINMTFRLSSLRIETLLGTDAKPYLEGNLTMKEGRIKLANLDEPIESGKIDLIARRGEIQLNELSFQLGAASLQTSALILMDGLLPQRYNGSLYIDNFQLDIIGRNFLKGEVGKSISGNLSVNAKAEMDLETFLNSAPNGDFGEMITNLIKTVTAEVTLPEQKVHIQIAGYPDPKSPVTPFRKGGIIYNPVPITIRVENGMLSFGCGLDYQRESGENPIFLRANGIWESNDQLGFEFKGYLDTQIIAALIQARKITEVQRSIDTPLRYVSNYKRPTDSEPFVSGSIRYHVSLRGTAREPQITIRWDTQNMPNINLLGADVDKFYGDISYQRGAFNVKGIEMGIEMIPEHDPPIYNNSFHVEGKVPFNLSLMPPVFSPSQVEHPVSESRVIGDEDGEEVDLTVKASLQKLDSLPFLAMQDATIDGNGEINMKVSGTIQEPQFSGNMTLNDVIYQIGNVDVNNTNIRITFDSKGIIIKQAEGEFNDGGYSVSEGKIGLESYKLKDLDVKLNWNNCYWKQPGIVSEKIISDGSDIRLRGTFDKPRLEGTVIVKSGTVQQSLQSIVKSAFSNQPQGRADIIFNYPLVKDLELDLNLQIPQTPDSFWLDTIGAKIRPQVNGRVVGPINGILDNRLVFVGQVNILEGEFSYLNRKFLINTGSIENTSQYVLDPKYDIVAEIENPIEADLESTQGQINREKVKITLELKGSLVAPQAPTLQAEVINQGAGEEYSFNQLEILELLTFGRIVSQQGEAASFASETATYLIMRQAETFVGKTLGLREFQLTLSDSEGSSQKFLFTKEISPQWVITYKSAYSLSANPYVNIEYRLNENISISGERNEYGKYGADLKYGIEW